MCASLPPSRYPIPILNDVISLPLLSFNLH